MRNILRFFVKYYFFFLFLAIEAVAIILLINNNDFQQAKIYNFSQNVSGSIFDRANNLKGYFYLKEINSRLIEENTALRNRLTSLAVSDMPETIEKKFSKSDTVRYIYLSANVINNSINKQYNYITIDKGALHGIEPEMAVISDNGIVGITKSVSPNFSTVISLLNRDLKISAKIQKNDYFGSLDWPGRKYNIAELNEIPHHVNVDIGDTIVTSGFSVIFPENVMIGFISDYRIVGGSFYSIEVKLSNDFKQLTHVYVLRDILKEEQTELEMELAHD